MNIENCMTKKGIRQGAWQKILKRSGLRAIGLTSHLQMVDQAHQFLRCMGDRYVVVFSFFARYDLNVGSHIQTYLVALNKA